MNTTHCLESIHEVSAARYQPMLRLLDRGDFEFFRHQRGVTAREVARLRLQRRRIFNGYLRALNSDFQRVAAALKFLIAESPEDRADLARLLLCSQARFACAKLRVQIRVLLFTLGIGSVDVCRLLKLLDCVQLQFQSLAPAPTC